MNGVSFLSGIWWLNSCLTRLTERTSSHRFSTVVSLRSRRGDTKKKKTLSVQGWIWRNCGFSLERHWLIPCALDSVSVEVKLIIVNIKLVIMLALGFIMRTALWRRLFIPSRLFDVAGLTESMSLIMMYPNSCCNDESGWILKLAPSLIISMN